MTTIAHLRPSPGSGVAVVLGGGGARGLAHIMVLEALDELGIRPVAIAGTSIGAMVGCAYAAGLSAHEIRAHATSVLRSRGEILSRLVPARVGRFADLFARGLSNPILLDSERLVDRFLPEEIPTSFEELTIPLTVLATDYFRRCEQAISSGPLRSAVAASIAVPGLLKPVMREGRLLVDGGAVNPLPFDHIPPSAGLVIACDVTGGPVEGACVVPTSGEILFGALQIMMHAIVDEKLRSSQPEILVRPNVTVFRALDFLKITAILKASQPVKDEVKRTLERALAQAA